jgi:hypothetical protein
MPTAPVLNGQIIGQAERSTRALLDRLLADHDLTFVPWVALNLLNTIGPLAEDDLVERAITGLRTPPASSSGPLTSRSPGPDATATPPYRSGSTAWPPTSTATSRPTTSPPRPGSSPR